MGASELMVVVISSLASGLVATFVTIYWQHQMELKKRKIDLLLELQGCAPGDERFTEALNKVPLVFGDSQRCMATLKTVIDSHVLPGPHLVELMNELWKDTGLKAVEQEVMTHRYGKKFQSR